MLFMCLFVLLLMCQVNGKGSENSDTSSSDRNWYKGGSSSSSNNNMEDIDEETIKANKWKLPVIIIVGIIFLVVSMTICWYAWKGSWKRCFYTFEKCFLYRRSRQVDYESSMNSTVGWDHVTNQAYTDTLNC